MAALAMGKDCAREQAPRRSEVVDAEEAEDLVQHHAATAWD